MPQQKEQMDEASATPVVSNSFMGNILTPGSSLNPTFLLLLDAAFGALLLVLLSLAVATRGNIHLISLMGIELALWASVKWFVHDLHLSEGQEQDHGTAAEAQGPSTRTKED
ncbi:uncharacterized protein LAESUDRAFT_710199 [Laetiporus sulphureus 93-53]|uniref:Pkr1-domain-containing protein n=1 Tax=Laetiporus sulphureus 93-53 TaxID=1314785 RepID=A0A165IIQ7_9APHY|nr:uncharacterized protein LAESUDRAFT_710199 [Laetiporus sulphureus 93-53]KZT13132.1 hypothetical protein LAESUDRAFT_710199 [Laetiporus sulphureus 93-53]